MNEMFEIKYNAIQPATGRLLISEPLLQDKYFQRTVILLVDHSKEGSFGVIINKVLEGVSTELFELLGAGFYLYFGGPVDTKSIFFIHKRPDLIRGGDHIVGNMYWGGNVDDLLDAIEDEKISVNDFRLFSGYSGWGPGQLERELSENTWAVAIPPNIDELFSIPHDKLWRKIVYTLGKDYYFWNLLPTDPQLN
jgi:putative transcriptional regulator